MWAKYQQFSRGEARKLILLCPMEVARLPVLAFFLVNKADNFLGFCQFGKGGGVKTILNTTALEPFAGIQCFPGIYNTQLVLNWNGTSEEIGLAFLVSGLAHCLYGETAFWRSRLSLIPLEPSQMILVLAFDTFIVVYLFFR